MTRPACARCGKDLTYTVGLCVLVNGAAVPRVLLCGGCGCNNGNVLTVADNECLHCGRQLTGEDVTICILADGRLVPGRLCINHGANDADEMTAAEYVRLVISAMAQERTP